MGSSRSSRARPAALVTGAALLVLTLGAAPAQAADLPLRDLAAAQGKVMGLLQLGGSRRRFGGFRVQRAVEREQSGAGGDPGVRPDGEV